jgi:hypothetical protein
MDVCIVITFAIVILLTRFEPYGDNLDVCVSVITVHIVMLLRNFGSYGIIFVTMCVYCFIFYRFTAKLIVL